jgi:hypothetical protein
MDGRVKKLKWQVSKGHHPRADASPRAALPVDGGASGSNNGVLSAKQLGFLWSASIVNALKLPQDIVQSMVCVCVLLCCGLLLLEEVDDALVVVMFWLLSSLLPRCKSASLVVLATCKRTVAHVIVTAPGTMVTVGGQRFAYIVGENCVFDGPLMSTVYVLRDGYATSSVVMAGLVPDVLYTLTAWSQSVSGVLSRSSVSTEVLLLSSAPRPMVVSRDPMFTIMNTVEFVFEVGWSGSSLASNVSLASLRMTMSVDNSKWNRGPGCEYVSHNNTVQCKLRMTIVSAGEERVYVRSELLNAVSSSVLLSWTFLQCQSGSEYELLGMDGNNSCVSCYEGLDCSDPSRPAVASGCRSSNTFVSALTVYKCPFSSACASTNVTQRQSNCVVGYSGTLSAMCEQGYFERWVNVHLAQEVVCHQCSSSLRLWLQRL